MTGDRLLIIAARDDFLVENSNESLVMDSLTLAFLMLITLNLVLADYTAVTFPGATFAPEEGNSMTTEESVIIIGIVMCVCLIVIAIVVLISSRPPSRRSPQESLKTRTSKVLKNKKENKSSSKTDTLELAKHKSGTDSGILNSIGSNPAPTETDM